MVWVVFWSFYAVNLGLWWQMSRATKQSGEEGMFYVMGDEMVFMVRTDFVVKMER